MIYAGYEKFTRRQAKWTEVQFQNVYYDRLKPMREWCEQYPGMGLFYHEFRPRGYGGMRSHIKNETTGSYWFECQEDAVVFALRWL